MEPVKLSDPKLFRQQCYINGEWRDAISEGRIDVTNPADGTVIASIPKMGAVETREAIEHARVAQVKWRNMLAKERSTILRRWFELMMENQEDLALLMTKEQGKPLAEARGEIGYSASFLEWFADEGRRISGGTIPQHQADKRLVVIKQPVGVCVAITPWNFPSAMITRKVGPALAAGCAVVVKPATQTPLSAFALCELAERAGLPAGLLSVDDADLDAAVQGAIISKYRNAGQTCVCSNRIYVQDGVYEEFAEKLAVEVEKMKVGSGIDDGVVQGPLIDMNAVEKVEEHIQDAIDQGAKVVVGGNRHEMGGTYFQPTLLTNVTSSMKVAREETFGPLAPLFRFTDEKEVIDMANDTEFGLASYFYSKDLARAWRVAEELEYGMVGINTGLISTEVAPFGGIKQSGLGREGSSHGIEEYLEMKYLCMGGIE
jgi:succinate-semialdehyde dehydrogenase/glutarate-semialdehyde dehydrogenase